MLFFNTWWNELDGVARRRRGDARATRASIARGGIRHSPTTTRAVTHRASSCGDANSRRNEAPSQASSTIAAFDSIRNCHRKFAHVKVAKTDAYRQKSVFDGFHGRLRCRFTERTNSTDRVSTSPLLFSSLLPLLLV